MKFNIRIIYIILFTLFLLNITSIFVRRDGSASDTLSYITRIGLYMYILYQITRHKFPQIIRKSIFYRLCYTIPLLLLIILFYTIIETGDFRNSISLIFPTFFILANNILFFYVGYICALNSDIQEKCTTILYIFAVASILCMSLITIYVVMKFGNLAMFWNEARDNNEYNIFLNVYKNVNPYRFAVLSAFLFLKKSKYNMPLVVICIINILIAGKRGPLLGIAVSSSILYVLNAQKRKKYLQYTIYALLVFAIYYLFDDNIFQTLLNRMDPSQHYKASVDATFYMSGRDQIWTIILEGFYKSSIPSQLIGHGVLGASEYLLAHDGSGNAHNTWCEILFNYGIVGLFIYFMYYLCMMKACFYMWHKKCRFRSLSTYLLIFSFVSSFYTVLLYGGLAAPGYSNMLFAFLFGNALNMKRRNMPIG